MIIENVETERVRKWGVDRGNENGQCLLNVFAERVLFLADPFFQCRLSTGMHGEWKNCRSSVDYIAVDERLNQNIVHAVAVRAVLNEFDSFADVAKVCMRERWETENRKKENRRIVHNW